MNLEYIIKKCQGFGYVKELSQIKMKEIKMKNPQIIYLKDPDTHKNPKNSIVYTDIFKMKEDLETKDKEMFDKPTIFFIEVGVPCQAEQNVDVPIDKDKFYQCVDDFEIDIDIDEEKKKTYKEVLKTFVTESVTDDQVTYSVNLSYIDYEFNPTFLHFLSNIYPKIEFTAIQRIILRILVKGGLRIDELLKLNPITYTTSIKDSVRLSSSFSDVKISDPKFDKSKDEIEDENIDSVTKDFMTLQSISRFNGFGNSFAQVDNTKKRANIPTINILRNHEIIHSLARNKIVATPDIYKRKDFSIKILMEIFSKFTNFSVIFIWPESSCIFTYDTYPSKKLEISDVNGNVILLVLFRFMAIHFFGMHMTVDHEDMYMKYLL